MNGKRWSEDEDMRLIRLFPVSTDAQLVKAFPDRSLKAIQVHACVLGVTRDPSVLVEGVRRVQCGNGYKREFIPNPLNLAADAWGYITSKGELRPMIGGGM